MATTWATRPFLALPRWSEGVATRPGESCAPEQWEGLVWAAAPCLGPTGNVLYDVSGYARHGTLTNMEPDTDWVADASGMGLVFGGTNESVIISSSAAPGMPLTMMCWASVPDVTGLYRLMTVGVSASNNQMYAIIAAGSITNDPIRVQKRTTSGVNADTTTAYTANTRFHACGVFASATDMRAYLNGGGKTTTVTSISPSATSSMRLGARTDDSDFLIGTIYEARIYNRIIDDGEVAALADWEYTLELYRKRPLQWAVTTGGGTTTPLDVGGTLGSSGTIIRAPARTFTGTL